MSVSPGCTPIIRCVGRTAPLVYFAFDILWRGQDDLRTFQLKDRKAILAHVLEAAPTARIRTLLDPRAVDLALSHSLAPRGDARQAWSLLALELWARDR